MHFAAQEQANYIPYHIALGVVPTLLCVVIVVLVVLVVLQYKGKISDGLVS